MENSNEIKMVNRTDNGNEINVETKEGFFSKVKGAAKNVWTKVKPAAKYIVTGVAGFAIGEVVAKVTDRSNRAEQLITSDTPTWPPEEGTSGEGTEVAEGSTDPDTVVIF